MSPVQGRYCEEYKSHLRQNRRRSTRNHGSQRIAAAAGLLNSNSEQLSVQLHQHNYVKEPSSPSPTDSAQGRSTVTTWYPPSPSSGTHQEQCSTPREPQEHHSSGQHLHINAPMNTDTLLTSSSSSRHFFEPHTQYPQLTPQSPENNISSLKRSTFGATEAQWENQRIDSVSELTNQEHNNQPAQCSRDSDKHSESFHSRRRLSQPKDFGQSHLQQFSPLLNQSALTTTTTSTLTLTPTSPTLPNLPPPPLTATATALTATALTATAATATSRKIFPSSGSKIHPTPPITRSSNSGGTFDLKWYLVSTSINQNKEKASSTVMNSSMPSAAASSSSLSTSTMLSTTIMTNTPIAPPYRVLSARGTPKGPLPIDVQIKLLSSVLEHDPFNCPIRRTTQVWERIAAEQGVRARTCARRYDNIIQASIAGRDRSVGTEEQIATKKKLLEQLIVMMNQPQALLRMQKKRRYRSEDADRKLLLETIRLNPFAQRVGQVAKAWEDVRDALGMKVHARQCMRRVNRMIKPYQLRERMYNGNIPEEMQEANDDLVKQVMQLMDQSGHGGSLEDDGAQSNDEDSASDSEDQDDMYTDSEARKRGLLQEDDELEDEDERMATNPMRVNSEQSLGHSTTQLSTSTLVSSSLSFQRPTTPTHRTRPRHSTHGSSDKAASEDSRPTRALEAEFRPQSIWGSHPYSKEAVFRSSYGSNPQKGRTGRNHSAEVTDARDSHQRPVKYTRSNIIIEGSSTQSAEPDQRLLYPSRHASWPFHTKQSSPLNSSSASTQIHSHESHPSLDESAAQGPLFIDSSSPLHQTILNEFHTVKGYLVRMDGQRKRDKENQKAMHSMIERLQYQVQEQQRSIQDLQEQVQYRQRQRLSSSSSSSYQHSPSPQHQNLPPPPPPPTTHQHKRVGSSSSIGNYSRTSPYSHQHEQDDSRDGKEQSYHDKGISSGPILSYEHRSRDTGPPSL
ncbi:hypothetical protein BGX27_010325 [Mortierella sp. AM989]|nr:hypothetical protein BGX27_010325 [Mortierella sp. AM989]